MKGTTEMEKWERLKTDKGRKDGKKQTLQKRPKQQNGNYTAKERK